jgi:tetratricopeptide (TPR) repeat protein
MKPGKLWWCGVAVMLAAGLMVYVSLDHRPGILPASTTGANPVAVEIQHPMRGAIMPRNMPAPVIVWKTNVPGVSHWTVQFKSGGLNRKFEGIQPMWRPPEDEWKRIKQAAGSEPIELTLTGFENDHSARIRALQSVRFGVSADAVETPLFYRDVNLPFIEAVKDPSKIRWRFGTIDSGALPPVVLEKLPVCGNCHSFSRKGEFLAMDVDYANNKGSYVITRTAPEMAFATEDIITWDDYRREDGEETLGLLSQISPDGRYVLSTVKDLSVFMPKPDLAFSQLFFPFKGIIGVYDRQTKKFASLPGADDPSYVQSNPTWSPDGQWVVFVRNRAVALKMTVARGRLLLTRDADEELFRQTKEYRFDLYRIPFNGGKGGKAEPLRGASGNGRSNYFPKYSPDGRWIIFCQAANYMLLQPDSELFIIPAEGGEARKLGCNLSRMNSWHSWSPDGRWLVFTSKEHSDYTQLYLSRISETGEASRPVWLAHMVEPNRVANIPEFVDLPPQGIARIRQQFLDDHSYVRAAQEFLRAGEADKAIEKYKMALSLNSNNITAHRLIGHLLKDTPNKKEALEHMQAVVRLAPRDPLARFSLGCALASGGDLPNAIAHFEEGVGCLADGDESQYEGLDGKHRLPEALHYKLGLAYQRMGNPEKEERHYREALRLAPDYAEVHHNLGILLLRSRRFDEAEAQFTETIRLLPRFGAAHNCLGIIRQQQNRLNESKVCFQEALKCDPNDWQAELNLARIHLAQGDREQAIVALREALRINPSCAPAQQALEKIVEQTQTGVPQAR